MSDLTLSFRLTGERGPMTNPTWVPKSGSILQVAMDKKFTTTELIACGLGKSKLIFMLFVAVIVSFFCVW